MSESERVLRETKTTHDGMFTFMGHSPQNKTLGIVGMGSIGKQLAKRAVAFDMKVIYYVRYFHFLPSSSYSNSNWVVGINFPRRWRLNSILNMLPLKIY